MLFAKSFVEDLVERHSIVLLVIAFCGLVAPFVLSFPSLGFRNEEKNVKRDQQS